MWRIIVAFPLVMHGLANLAGFIMPWVKRDLGFTDTAWLLPGNATLRGPVGRIWSFIWLASSIFLVGSGVGVLLQETWWISAAVAGSVISLISILPWWKAVPPGARFAVFFDVLLLGLLISPLGKRIDSLIS